MAYFRIEYYSKLRNKCFELLYEVKNLNFENTIVIFFNDIPTWKLDFICI